MKEKVGCARNGGRERVAKPFKCDNIGPAIEMKLRWGQQEAVKHQHLKVGEGKRNPNSGKVISVEKEKVGLTDFLPSTYWFFGLWGAKNASSHLRHG